MTKCDCCGYDIPYDKHKTVCPCGHVWLPRRGTMKKVVQKGGSTKIKLTKG